MLLTFSKWSVQQREWNSSQIIFDWLLSGAAQYHPKDTVWIEKGAAPVFSINMQPWFASILILVFIHEKFWVIEGLSSILNTCWRIQVCKWSTMGLTRQQKGENLSNKLIYIWQVERLFCSYETRLWCNEQLVSLVTVKRSVRDISFVDGFCKAWWQYWLLKNTLSYARNFHLWWSSR